MRSILSVFLVLLFASSAAADTFEMYCDSNCAECSIDAVCNVDGVCAETYEQCYSRCMISNGSSAPTSTSTEYGTCAPTWVVGWDEYDSRRMEFRWVYLMRCGALHWLKFGPWMDKFLWTP